MPQIRGGLFFIHSTYANLYPKGAHLTSAHRIAPLTLTRLKL